MFELNVSFKQHTIVCRRFEIGCQSNGVRLRASIEKLLSLIVIFRVWCVSFLLIYTPNILIYLKNSSSQFANILRVFKCNLNLINGLFTGFRPFLHSFLSTILLFILLFSLFLFSFFGWCVSCVYIVYRCLASTGVY